MTRCPLCRSPLGEGHACSTVPPEALPGPTAYQVAQVEALGHLVRVVLAPTQETLREAQAHAMLRAQATPEEAAARVVAALRQSPDPMVRLAGGAPIVNGLVSRPSLDTPPTDSAEASSQPPTITSRTVTPAVDGEGPNPDADFLAVLESCTGEPLTEEQSEALWQALDTAARAHDYKMRTWGPRQVMRRAIGGDMARLALEYATARLAREGRGEVLCTDTGCDAKATGWLDGEPWCARHDPRNTDG